MPLISRGVPAYTNDSCGGGAPASSANDANYDTQWHACGTPSTSAPIFLAYDLSSVAVTSRGQVVVAWYNDPTTYHYSHSYLGQVGYDIPSAYTLEGNAAAGGALPSSGWVALASVSGNGYHSRQHLINMTGYNWLRMVVTASDGSSGNFGVYLNLDVHDASAGVGDDWIFFGDSITEGWAQHATLSSGGGTGTLAQVVNGSNASFFPVYEDGGIGGTLSSDGAGNINSWLSIFPGHYVGLSYGTNDAGFSVSPTTFYNNYSSMVQAVLAAGKIPVIPKIPWGCTSAIQANAPGLNQQLDALYAAYAGIVRGPDLWTYFQSNQGLVSSDCIHPTTSGYVGMRQQWANAMQTAVYGASPPPPPPALQISGVAASAVTQTTAQIGWQTNNAASSRVDYGTTTAYGGVASDATLVTAHALTLSALSAGTTYHYRVTSVDGSGQSAQGADGTFTTSAAGATNLLANPGFESGSTGWSLAATASIDTLAADAHAGSGSLKLVATGAWQNNSQIVPVTAGQSYTLSGWARSTTSNAFLTIVNYDSSWNVVGAHTDIVFPATGSWTFASVSYVPPAGTVNAYVTAMSSVAGTFFFDDLSLAR